MKRFFSSLLIAIMVLTCLTTVAFAATEVKTGDEKTFTVTVSGDEFTNYGLKLSADAGLEIVKISGATGNVSTGKVAYAGMENVTSHSFQVTVKVTATEPGTYNVYASVLEAGKMVTEETEDGTVVKLVNASVSANGASFEIKKDEPKPTEPKPTEPTPTEPKPTEPKPTDPVVDMGDITPYGMYSTVIALVVVAMVGAVALVFKRKAAK